MSFTSIVQILKVGEVQDKSYEGRAYKTQQCECLLLNQDGTVEAVGVLSLNEKFRQNPPDVGTYSAVFSLVASPKDRKIGAVVTGLTPIPLGAAKRVQPTAAAA